MSDTFSGLLRIKKLPTGRRIYALDRTKEAAKGVRGAERIRELCEEARAHDLKRTRPLEKGWRAQAAGGEGRYDEQMRGHDQAADALVVNFHDHISGIVEMSGETGADEAGIEALGWLLKRNFPDGVGAVTQLSYSEQAVELKAIREDMESATFRPAVDAFSLKGYVDAMGRRVDSYTETERDQREREVSYEDVVAARQKGYEHIAYLIATIAADFREDAEVRQQLLAPVLEQDRMVTESMRRRRVATDVDPETGEEVEDDAGS